MIPWDTIVHQGGNLLSWAADLISSSASIIGGGISALIGAYAASVFQSQERKREILREDVCRPMMPELEKVQSGKVPTESSWEDIDTVSKQLLDNRVLQNIREYIKYLEEVSELNSRIRDFERQVAQGFKKDQAVITSNTQKEIFVKISEYGHPRDPYEYRFNKIPLSEFVKELPDSGEIYSNGRDPVDGVPENIEDWAESDCCPFDDLISVWGSASNDWESEFKHLFNRPISRYQENVRKKEAKKEKLQEKASIVFSELQLILKYDHAFHQKVVALFR